AHDLVFIHRRLCQIYHPHKMFGGKKLALTGDFLKIPAIGGDLCKNMYMFSDGDQTLARELFAKFRIFEFPSEQQMRAQCQQQQQVLLAFRVLPVHYPQGIAYSKQDKNKPLAPLIQKAIVNPLTSQDIQNDPNWMTLCAP
ncbi:unnamed protein product, partial [Heterosigma akashiwo]